MSKISEYIRSQKESESKQTVEEFAREFKKPLQTLLRDLRAAGVRVSDPGSVMTAQSKRKLLAFLQKEHGGLGDRKKINIKRIAGPATDPYLRKVADQENGAEWELLQRFAGEVIVGNEIEPAIQRTVNLVLAKAVVSGALPAMRRGRPKRHELEEIGFQVAQRYWDMRDAGQSYAETVEVIAKSVHKDERHIMRLVKQHGSKVGRTPDERARKRAWVQLMHDFFGRDPSGMSQYQAFFERADVPEFTIEDYIEHLDEMIRCVISSEMPLT